MCKFVEASDYPDQALAFQLLVDSLEFQLNESGSLEFQLDFKFSIPFYSIRQLIRYFDLLDTSAFSARFTFDLLSTATSAPDSPDLGVTISRSCSKSSSSTSSLIRRQVFVLLFALPFAVCPTVSFIVLPFVLPFDLPLALSTLLFVLVIGLKFPIESFDLKVLKASI